MKCVLLAVLVIISQNVEVASNVTVTTPEPLLTNLTDFITEIIGNQSIAVGDILLSDIMQEVLNTYGSTGIASAINNVDGTLAVVNLMAQLQYIIDQLGAMDNACSQQLALFIAGVNKTEEWALRMLDATAKIQSGILEGNTMFIGHFDECLKIDVVVNKSRINGQYCTSLITDSIENSLKPDLKDNAVLLKQSYGFCVPSVCDESSLDAIARVLEEAFQSPLHFKFVDDLCMSNVKGKSLSNLTIVSTILFSAVGLIVACSTIYDIYFFKKQKHQGPSLLTAFSFYTNGNKLLSTKKSADSLGCLNGMKVISMMWIILAHRYMYSTFLPLTNLIEVLTWPSEVAASVLITAGNMAVDTFFVISGLLVVYVYLLHREKGQSISFVMFYVHRILRLTPAVAALALFYSAFMNEIGSGPLWSFISDTLMKDCRNNWWSTLLYIQNYVYPNESCISQSWYLAVDTQLYFLSPLLLLPLVKWPKQTLYSVGCLTLICCAITFYITWSKNLGTVFFLMGDLEMEYLYSATHVRAPAWLIGTLLGYILFKIRNTVIKMNKVVKLLIWCISLAAMVGIIAYHKRVSRSIQLSLLEISLGNSLLRAGWALGLSVIIFLCVTGHGGVINRFLSSPIFTVLVRINYSVYLLHILVLVVSLGHVKTPQYESHLENFYYFWGDYVISSLLAVVWTLVFESPVIILEKVAFGNQRPKKDVQTEPERYNNNISVVIIENKLENDAKLNKI